MTKMFVLTVDLYFRGTFYNYGNLCNTIAVFVFLCVEVLHKAKDLIGHSPARTR